MCLFPNLVIKSCRRRSADTVWVSGTSVSRNAFVPVEKKAVDTPVWRSTYHHLPYKYPSINLAHFVTSCLFLRGKKHASLTCAPVCFPRCHTGVISHAILLPHFIGLRKSWLRWRSESQDSPMQKWFSFCRVFFKDFPNATLITCHAYPRPCKIEPQSERSAHRTFN